MPTTASVVAAMAGCATGLPDFSLRGVRCLAVHRGVFAAVVVGLLFCAEHLRDTLLIR